MKGHTIALALCMAAAGGLAIAGQAHAQGRPQRPPNPLINANGAQRPPPTSTPADRSDRRDLRPSQLGIPVARPSEAGAQNGAAPGPRPGLPLGRPTDSVSR